MNTIWCICNLSLPFSFFFYRSGHKNTIQFRTLSGGSKLQSMERCYEDGGSSSRRSSYRVPQKSMHHLLINNVVYNLLFSLYLGTFFHESCALFNFLVVAHSGRKVPDKQGRGLEKS